MTATSGTTRVLTTLDALDRTFQRTTSGTVTDYTYRGLSERAAKTVAGTTTTTYGFTAGGSPLGQKVGTNAASYYLRDPHGDSVGVVSTAAANQGTSAFDP